MAKVSSNTSMQDRHKEITADENDIKQLQLHTHKVKAKSTCKFGAHDKMLACLGSTNTPGRSVERLRKDLAEQFSLKGGYSRARAK